LINPLESRGNYDATPTSLLVHWLLMDGLLNLVQQGGDWAARFVPTPPAIDTPLGGPP